MVDILKIDQNGPQIDRLEEILIHSADLVKSYLQSILKLEISSIFRCLQLKKAVDRGQDLVF